MTKGIKLRQAYSCLVIALTLVTGFSSCESKSEISADAFVRVANSSEGSTPQDFYLNNSKVNTSAVAYTQSSNYATTSNGNKTGEFRSTGTATVNSSASLNIEAGKYYTVYYTGGTASSASFTTLDEQTTPSTGKAKVRFVHLSSAAAASIDLAIQGGAKVVSNLAYKTASAYQEVNAATNFQLFASGSTTAALTLSNLNLQAGKIYTVYISGSTSATVSYHILVDKQ
jgi:Domain of unknown function (DUF4397)